MTGSRRFSALLVSVSLIPLISLPLTYVGAEDAALLVAPAELHAGGQSALTLSTFDSLTHEAVARPVVVTLLRGGNVVSTIHAGATGSEGHLRIAFGVPAGLEPGDYKLRAAIAGIGEPLEVSTTISRTPAILIETDKPIYKPGQTIQGRVVLLSNALTPVSGTVELAVHDAKGIRVDRRELTANEYGAASFSLDLASEVNFGVWKIKVRSENVESIRDVRVEEYVLPRFDLSVSWPRTWALVDEAVTGTVNARYFFGRDVEGRATVVAKRWVGTWEEYSRTEGDLQGGAMEFTLPAVGFVAGSPQNSGQGGVTVDVEVTDSTGNTQTTTEVLTISQSSLVLGLIPRVRSMKPDIPFEVLVTAKTPDGQPLDAQVTVNAEYFGRFGDPAGAETQVVEVQGGRGIVELAPTAESFYAELSASGRRDGRTATTSVRVDGSFSAGNSFLALIREDGDGPLSVGSQPRFQTTSTHPGTVYYEVYAGGRTVLSGASESDGFSFAVTHEMVPAARVVAYKINPDNEVSADVASIEVNLASSIAIISTFGGDEVKPGDAVTLRIDAGTGKRTLLGVSLVDESVLALGRSRLHLADVFAELERRFLEPQAEVHDGGGDPVPGGPGGGPGLVADFGPGGFRPPRLEGSLDVLESVGLVVAASRGISLPRGEFIRGLFPEAFDVDVADGAAPPADDGGPPDVVRVRQYFPETWVWEPLLLTDEAGIATLELTAPDSITNWKLGVVGTCSAGVDFGQKDLTVFQEFFVEPSLPFSVTRGEEFPVKVDVFNYLDEAQQVDLSFGDAEWFDLLGESELQVTVPPNSVSSVTFPIRPTRLGEQQIRITALGSSLSDAVLRPIAVRPEGLPSELVFNDVIEPGGSLPLDLSFPASVVAGSSRAFLHITPSPVAQTLNGVSDLLGMPYGCGEQNMIFLAPDVEILKYLREIGELSTEIRATAEFYVNVGYQRELTFQTTDGGFAAFGGEQGSLWLTAFVLSTFSCAREVRDIDETVLAQAAGMLVGRQNTDGSFRTDDFLIHKEMDGGLENLYAMTAYVTNALADYAAEGNPSGDVTTALGRAAGYLRGQRTTVADDAYSQSIAAVALGKVPGFTDTAEEVIDRLLELAVDEGVGIHWEPYPVETTGYVAMALLSANGGNGRPQAGEAIDWLGTQRNSLGGYGGSTQDTVVAIRTLFQAARRSNRDLDVTLSLVSGEETLWSLHVDSTNFDVLHSTPLQLPGEGDPPLELRSSGRGSVGYQVSRRFNVPGTQLPPSRDMLIEVDYQTDGIDVDDILDVRVRLLYSGFKEATGMVIADVGVPTGFQVVGASTAALIEAETVSRVEIAGRKVIFYIDSLRGGEALEFTFQMRALFPVRAEGPISEAYEYYDSVVRGYHRMATISIDDGSSVRLFVRGDGNVDGTVDLSDAVTTLNYLFVGEGAATLRCRDAADANDDGTINITDPIYLLQFLFLGGPPPAAPHTAPGVDPTEDDLDCRRGV
ncbi:MAG: MG2 domain-containing protein [Planctomycetota bacterium]|nr:MG2 domain-containing protein [Planctomycetota bacterium]